MLTTAPHSWSSSGSAPRQGGRIFPHPPACHYWPSRNGLLVALRTIHLREKERITPVAYRWLPIVAEVSRMTFPAGRCIFAVPRSFSKAPASPRCHAGSAPPGCPNAYACFSHDGPRLPVECSRLCPA